MSRALRRLPECLQQLLFLTLLVGAVEAREPNTKPAIVPLFDEQTKLEPATAEETADALITRIGDRVRGRHAREAKFHAYDEYNTFYWEYRTVGIEIVDRVAKGGDEVTFNITQVYVALRPESTSLRVDSAWPRHAVVCVAQSRPRPSAQPRLYRGDSNELDRHRVRRIRSTSCCRVSSKPWGAITNFGHAPSRRYKFLLSLASRLLHRHGL